MTLWLFHDLISSCGILGRVLDSWNKLTTFVLRNVLLFVGCFGINDHLCYFKSMQVSFDNTLRAPGKYKACLFINAYSTTCEASCDSALIIHKILQNKPVFMINDEAFYGKMKSFTLQILHRKKVEKQEEAIEWILSEAKQTIYHSICIIIETNLFSLRFPVGLSLQWLGIV